MELGSKVAQVCESESTHLWQGRLCYMRRLRSLRAAAAQVQRRAGHSAGEALELVRGTCGIPPVNSAPFCPAA